MAWTWLGFVLSLALLSFCVCDSEKIEISKQHWQYPPVNKSLNFACLYDKNSNGNCSSLESGYPKDSLKLLWERIHYLSPTFTLSSKTLTNERCRKDNEKYLSDLVKMKFWALKMYDSSGKFTSGFLSGNVNQFGDYDQCLSVENAKAGITGKYCLAYFQVHPKKGQYEKIRQTFAHVHSHYAISSKMNDPGHRIPKFSTINWAVCVPDSCSHEDVESQLRDLIFRYTDGLDFDIEVRVDSEMCYVKKPFQLSQQFIIVSLFFAFVAVIVCISTITDVLYDKPSSSSSYMDFLQCFSLKRNFKQLTTLSSSSDDISSIHGIRMICAIFLIVAHKTMTLMYPPVVNRTQFIESISTFISGFVRMASFYTDSFIMISGILTAYSLHKTLKNKGSINITSEYFNRLLRIYPLLFVTILVSTFILPELGSGPQWGSTVSHHSEECKNTWWKNFLFVHNYFGFENMCLTHTHHLGIDTQLFFLSPFLVYIVHKWQWIGISVLVSLSAISTGLRYQITLEKQISYFIYPGIELSRLIDTANYSYIIPSHRITVYSMGLITGYILQHYGRDIKIKSNIRRLCWMICFSLFCYIVSETQKANFIGYKYDKYEAASYSALTPIAWCLIQAWIIIATHLNYGGIIGRILSFKYWALWTKISYAVYLVQFPIFFFNVGQQRYSREISRLSVVNVPELTLILLSSIIVTLFFDLPTSNIRKLFRKAQS